MPPKSTKTEEKKLSCPECPYKIARNFDLQRHIRTHTGKRPFVCQECDKVLLGVPSVLSKLKYNTCKQFLKKMSCGIECVFD